MHSDLRRIGTFACSDDSSTSCTATWSGASGATSSTCRPTARSATSGRGGPVTSRCSPRPRPTCSTCRGFLRDWLLDLAAEQRAANDIVPLVVPDVLKLLDNPTGWPSDTPTAIWSDAGVWVPWALWEAYGDREVLEQCHPSMAAHVRACARLVSANGLWDTGFQLGDWLDPTAPPENPFRGQGGQVRDRDGLPLSQRGPDRPRAPPSSGRRTTRPSSLPSPSATAGRVQRALRDSRRHGPERLPDRVRAWRSRSVCWRPRPRAWPASDSPTSSPRAGTGSPPGSPGRRT